MIFTIGEDPRGKAARLGKWHRYFFWLPRRISAIHWVWLQWGYRRAIYHYQTDFHSWVYSVGQK